MFNDDGHFKPKALAVLSRSFVDMKTLPAEPDMSKLINEVVSAQEVIRRTTGNESGEAHGRDRARARPRRRRRACAARLAPAQAAEKLRVGKAVPEAFSFTPIEIGMRTGIFAKNGLEIESIAFTGDARMQQAAAAGSIDILLGSGPAMAFIVKGAPIKASPRWPARRS